MYKILSKNLNGHEIQELIDKIEESYIEVKKSKKSKTLSIEIYPIQDQDYPFIKEVSVKVI